MAEPDLAVLYTQLIDLRDEMQNAGISPAPDLGRLVLGTDLRVTVPTTAPDIRTATEMNARALALLERLTPLVSLVASGIGECRMLTPYAPLRPVIQPNGDFQWCCTHDPQHCG